MGMGMRWRWVQRGDGYSKGMGAGVRWVQNEGGYGMGIGWGWDGNEVGKG